MDCFSGGKDVVISFASFWFATWLPVLDLNKEESLAKIALLFFAEH